MHIDSNKVDGPTAGTHTFDALEFLAKFLAHDQPSEDIPDRVRARQRRWAALLRRIWDVDVETRPSCGGNMEILAFTLDPPDIDATLRALRNKGVDPRAGPWTARAPPTLAA